MSFKDDIISSEFNIILEKEREMRDLYDEILKRVQNEHVRKVIEVIRDDEKKHMGYAEIILSMMERIVPNDKS